MIFQKGKIKKLHNILPESNENIAMKMKYLEYFYNPTWREFYAKNFQIRILNRGQVEKLTSSTKRI